MTTAQGNIDLFGQQDGKKKRSIYNAAVSMQASRLGVWIQKIPETQFERTLGKVFDPDADPQRATDAVPARPDVDADPVLYELRRLHRTFAAFANDVDMRSAAHWLYKLYRRFKAEGRKGHGVIVLVWNAPFDDEARVNTRPKLVGMATAHDFFAAAEISTSAGEISARDRDVLEPFMGEQTMYIDTLGSNLKGVGRLLVQVLFQHAMSAKKTSVVAMAYAPTANATPASSGAFVTTSFDVLIPRATYVGGAMHGTWYRKLVRDIDLSGFFADGVEVCVRRGLTSKTQDSIMWRCQR